MEPLVLAVCSPHPHTCAGLGSSHPGVYSSFTDETPPLLPVTRCHLDLDRECPRTSFLGQKREAASCGPAVRLLTDSDSPWGGVTVTDLGEG